MVAFSHTSACFFLWAAFLISSTISAPAPVAEGDLSQTQALDYHSDSGSKSCYYNFQHYEEGDRIVTNEPCLNCTCHKRMLMCYLRVCPFTKAIGQDCTIEKKPDQCCPVITCPQVPVDILTSSTTAATSTSAVGHLSKYGCTLEDNTFYPDGVQMPSDHKNPCTLCYCIRNQTSCVRQECTLNVEGCRPVYQEGVCCPVRYDCDYNEISTTERPSTGGLQLGTTASPLQCRYGDTLYNDGELMETEKPCESCYCMRGDIVCAVRSCGEPLEGSDCEPLPPPKGQCCPTTYKCANGTFPVEELVTQSSIVMHPADLQTSEPTNEPKQDQHVEDATDSTVEESVPEKTVEKEVEASSSELPKEEEKEPEKSVEDEQTDVTDEHIEADPVDIDDELPHAVEADDIAEPDNTHLATDSPLLSTEDRSTSKPDSAVVEISQGEIGDDESTPGPASPEEGSVSDINQSAITNESEPKPEEESTTDVQNEKEKNEEVGSGEESSATESEFESHEGSINVTPAQDSVEKDDVIQSKPEENKDKVPETNNEKDNVNQDEVTEAIEEHNEQKLSPSDEILNETEQSESKPDNVRQSTDIPELESSPTTENNNILIHEESAPSIPSTPEVFDQTHESDASSQSSGLVDNKDNAEALNNDENAIHEETPSNALTSPEALDQTHESDTSGQSDLDAVTDLPSSNANVEVPISSDTEKNESSPENVHDDSDLKEQEGIEAHAGSFPKEPIPPRRDDAAPEEPDQHLKHPEGSMTKAEDSIPEDQTKPTLLEPEQPDKTEPATDEESKIPTPSTTDEEESASEDTSTNENVDTAHETFNVHSDMHDDHPIQSHDIQEPITEEIVNVEEHTISSVSNVNNEEIESESISNDKKPEENIQTEPQTPVESDSSKPTESNVNVDVTESEQDSTTDISSDQISKDETNSNETMQESTQETSGIAHDGQEESAGDDENKPATNTSSDESTQEPLKGVDDEVSTEGANSQQVAEISDPTSSNIVSDNDSLVSLDENTESSTKESNTASEELTTKVQAEVSESHDKNEGESPVTKDEPAEATIVSNQTEETSMPGKDGADHQTLEGPTSEENSSEATPNQANQDNADIEGVETETPIKELEGESDELTKIEPEAKPDQSEIEKEDVVEPYSQSESTSESHTPSSAPENLHDETNIDESELQEVPHDHVDSDPTDIEENELEGENELPSENEIVDHLSGHGGSIDHHDTKVPMPGPVGVIPGEGDCLVDGQSYYNNSKIPSKSPCHKECFCMSSIVHCHGIDCPAPPQALANCMPVHQGDLCCPVYTCDGDTPEGPQSHNQIGGVDDPLGEEHTSSPSEVDSTPEKPSDVGSFNVIDSNSEANEPSSGSSEQITGGESVAEDSTQVVESETHSSVDVTGSNGPVQNHDASPDISELPGNEVNNQPDKKGSTDSVDENTENEPTVSVDSEVKQEDQTNDDDKNQAETTDIPAELNNEKSDPTSEDQNQPTESSEENSSMQSAPDDNNIVATPIHNDDNSEQHSVLTDDSEGHIDVDSNQNPTEELPTKQEEPTISEQETPSEEDAHKSGIENGDESQVQKLDEDNDTKTSEIVTEISSDNTENDDELSEESSNTAKPEEHVGEAQTEVVQDTISPIGGDESLTTSEQENKQTISSQENHETMPEDNQTTGEEVKEPIFEEDGQTNKDKGEQDISPVDIAVKPTESSESVEENSPTPLEDSSDTPQDINEANENIVHDNESDTKSTTSEDNIKQNNDDAEDANAPTEYATTNPSDDITVSELDKTTDGPLQGTNSLSDDENSKTEVPEKIIETSPNQNLSEGETVSPDTAENSPSVEEAENEESPEVIKETSLNTESNVNTEEAHEDPTHTPIIEEQEPNVIETTEKQSLIDHDSNILVTETGIVDSSESVKDHQSESTDASHVENETEAPVKASNDGSPGDILENNSENFADDNADESNTHHEEVTESYTGPEQSLGTEKQTAEIELSSETYSESTKEPDISGESISTEGYSEHLHGPESDSQKISEDSVNVHPTDQEHDSAHELDSSSSVSPNSDSVLVAEEEVNKPVPENIESDNPQPTDSEKSEDQLPLEVGETDEASQSNQKPDQEEQSANTPEQPVENEKTTGTTDQPTETNVGSEESNQGEGTLVQGESEIPVQESESVPSIVEPVPDLEGAHVNASDHKEEETGTNEEGVSVNDLITTVPEVEQQKQEAISEHEVEPTAQDGDSANANIDEHSPQEVESTGNEAEHTIQEDVEPVQEVAHPPQEFEQPTQEPEHPAHEVEHTVQDADQIIQEGEQPAQEIDQMAHEVDQPTQEAEEPTQEAEQPTQEVEHPTQGVEQPAQEVEKPTQEAEQPTQEVEHPTQEPEQHTQEVEQPAQEVEHPTQEVEHTDQEVEHTAQEVEHTAQEVEPTAQEAEHIDQEVEQPVQEAEHTDEEPDSNLPSIEHPVQESDNTISAQPEQETEHTDNIVEIPTQGAEQPDHHSEESTHEIEDPSHTSSQSQDSSSLPIPSEETHSAEEESKPDISKPDDSDFPAEDQFPSSPDMDYDGSEDGAFGPGTCRYGGKVYVSAQQIPRDDPCDFCFCFRSDIICLQQSCPPPIHRCHQEPIQGYCCPRYQCPVSMATSLNLTTTTTTTTTTLPPHFFAHAYLGAARQAGCLHKGRAYSVGDEIKQASGPCLHCICGADGQMRCDPKVCSPEPQLRRMMEAAISHRRR